MKPSNLTASIFAERINKLGTRLAAVAVTIALLAGGSVAQATPAVVHDPEGNVTHIYGLEWNSQVYDVEFVTGRGNDVFGGIIFDFNTQEDALTAADVVDDVLNAESTSVTTVGSPGLEQSLYNIPWQINGSNARVVRGEIQSGEWTAFVPSTGSIPTDDALDYAGLAGDYSWANFTETDAPPSGNQPAVANTGGPYTGEVDVAVDFDGSASNDPDGEIIAWLWKFGDSASASGETVSHTYDTEKVFNVTLEVTDSQGAVSSDSTSAEIVLGEQPPQPPEADAGGPYYGEAGVAVNFDGNRSIDPDTSAFDESGIKFFEWDFDDGNFASGSKQEAEYVSHTYDEPGVYDVVLTVTDEDGMVDSDNAWANISGIGQPETEVILDANNLTTVIRIENLPIRLTSGQTVVYNIDFIYDKGRNVFELESDFPFRGNKISREANANLALIAIGNALNGNATVPDSAGVPSEDIFYIGIEPLGAATSAVGGEFAVAEWEQCGAPNCLQGSATVGLDDLVTYADLVVSDPQDPANNPPPVAVSGGPYTGTAGAAVDFDGSASSDEGGSITAWVWEFGDSDIEFGETTSHVYETDAVYPVTLWVVDDTGQMDSVDTTATVGVGNQPPVSDPGGPYKGSVGTPVSFDGTDSSDPDGTLVSYAWNFGDETIGTGATPDHTYNSVGAYIVTLEVTDGDAAKSSRFAVAVIAVAAPNPEVTPVPDVNGDGANEVALSREGSVQVEVRNGSDGSLRANTTWLADPYTPVSIISMPDINGNGQAEIAALGFDKQQDKITVRVADGATNAGIRKFDYGSGGFNPIDLAAVSDVSGNGAADVAVLGVRRSDGRIFVQTRDVLTGQNALGVNIQFLDGTFTPLALAVLPNVLPSSSSDELVVFATRNSDGRGVVEIREADGTSGFTRIWFLDTTFTPKAIAIGDDADNNGIPEIAMLAARTSDQRIVIERRNATGAPATTRHWYFSEGWAAIDFTAVADTDDADNLPEYAVLAVRSDGKPAVEIRNAGEPKATFRRFFIDESFTALQVEDFGDTNGNGSTNIGVLGTQDSDDRPKLELRDVRGDANTQTIWFAP